MNRKQRQEIAEAVRRDPSLRRVAEALGVRVVREWGDDPSLPLPDDPQERELFRLGHRPDWGQ